MPAFALTTPGALQPLTVRTSPARPSAVPLNLVLRATRTPMQLSLFGTPPRSR
jgi:hypothetical protein